MANNGRLYFLSIFFWARYVTFSIYIYFAVSTLYYMDTILLNTFKPHFFFLLSLLFTGKLPIRVSRRLSIIHKSLLFSWWQVILLFITVVMKMRPLDRKDLWDIAPLALKHKLTSHMCLCMCMCFTGSFAFVVQAVVTLASNNRYGE